MSASSTDLVVVGGGPAGLALAIAACLGGLTVEVLDRSSPPIDKACGEGIMPDGVARLESWGVRLSANESSRFVGIRFLDRGLVAGGRFPGGPGLAVRRVHLHAAMVERASELGIRMRWGVRAEGLLADGVQTPEGPVRGRYVVGADGLHSRVRRWAQLEGRPAALRRFGVRRHFACVPWSDHVEVHWGPRCEAYVTGSGPHRVGVALLWSGETADFDMLLERFPALGERLHGAEIVSRDRGAGPLCQRVRGVVRGNVALLGDAAGYVDAITGEGLAVAFHEAAALAEAVVQGRLDNYARRHRRLRLLSDTMTTLLLLAERHPRKRARFLRLVAERPELFERLLGVHSRQLPPRSLGALAALRLGVCLLS